jgi:hypothetical protein
VRGSGSRGRRAGRGLDRVVLIAAALVPFDLERDSVGTFERVAAAVDELVAAGLIHRYEIGGVRYLQVADSGDWQRPQRPTPSRFPAFPPEDSGATPEGLLPVVRGSGFVGLTPDGGHLTGGTAGPAGRMSVCRASVGSTPRSFGNRLPAW